MESNPEEDEEDLEDDVKKAGGEEPDTIDVDGSGNRKSKFHDKCEFILAICNGDLFPRHSWI